MPISAQLVHNMVKVARKELVGLAAMVMHSKAVSTDAYGNIEYGASVEVKAFIVRKQKQVLRAPDGREVISPCQVLIPESYEVDVIDRITLPDGTAPAIVEVRPLLDDKGKPYITEVLLS